MSTSTHHNPDVQSVPPGPASTGTPTSSTSPPILRLPNELLDNIFSHLDSPQTYLSLSLVCRRFQHNTTLRSSRRLFTTTWFATHCNDQPAQAPRVLEYGARYIRRHSRMQASRQEGCHTRYGYKVVEAVEGQREYVQKLRSAPGRLREWRMFTVFDDWPEGSVEARLQINYLSSVFGGEERVQWMLRVMERIAEVSGGDEAECVRRRGRWTVETVAEVLNLEDVVLADVLYRVYRSREVERWGLGVAPNPYLWMGHQYLNPTMHMMEDYICVCGSDCLALVTTRNLNLKWRSFCQILRMLRFEARSDMDWQSEAHSGG